MFTRVVLCGVGGQGTILAAHVLAQSALHANLDVKVSEIHGMSQRGGSVTTVVTFGDSVSSMVCSNASADFLVSFDALEALRFVNLLKSDGQIITNDAVIKPTSVLTGNATIPNNIDTSLLERGAIIVPAAASALEAGNRHTSNMVMVGALANFINLDEDIFIEVIKTHVPQKTIDSNITAFKLGLAFAREHS